MLKQPPESRCNAGLTASNKNARKREHGIEKMGQNTGSGHKWAAVSENAWQLLLLLCPLFLTFLLYWPTLSQPYFWDDVPHFDFATTRTFLQLWTDVRGLSYYRPLTFSLYKILFEVLPPGKTTLPHMILLFVHTGNAWLVGNVLRRMMQPRGETDSACWIPGLTASQAAGLLASLLFVIYPFAVLPASHFAAFMHPLVTFFTLGTTLSALLFVTTNGRLWFPVAAGLALLAPFVHESGVMAGAVAAMVVAFNDWTLARRNWRLLVLLPCASIAFLPVWCWVPKTPNTFEWTGWGGILASMLFFIQGPTFPLQPLSRTVMEYLAEAKPDVGLTIVGLPLRDLVTIGSISLVAMILATPVLWQARRLRVLVIALAWTALAALPSILVLPFPYVSVSQRLLYSAGPASAMLWAAVCVSLATRARHPATRAAAVTGLAIAIAAVPVLYLRREMVLHETALRPLEQMAALARQHPDEQHLVVNAVNWINYKQPWYALGHEGVSVSAVYVDFEGLVQINSGSQARFATATYPAIKTELPRHYYSTIHEEAPWDAVTFAAEAPGFDRIWLTVYDDHAVQVVEAGSVSLEPCTSIPKYRADFDGKARLLDATLDIQDQSAILELRWHYFSDLRDFTVFRHLRNCAGQLVGQGDGRALAGMLPWDSLTPGTVLRDVRHIPLESISDDGCYIAQVGLYSADGQRVPVWGSDGVILSDSAVPVTFVVDGSP